MSNIDLAMGESNYLKTVNLKEDTFLREEFDGFTRYFDSIRFPGEGGLIFEVTGADGEIEAVKEIEGVILYHHPMNSFYRTKYSGVNTAPDCGSFDGKLGTGNPGGACEECPFNTFGSDEFGIGKACKNKRRIFLLLQGQVFPVMLTVPSASLKDFTAYITRLISKGKRSSSVVTKIGLKKAVSRSGKVFSQAVFTAVRDLTEEETAAVTPCIEFVKALNSKISSGGAQWQYIDA